MASSPIVPSLSSFVCTKCGVEKPLDDYYISKTRSGYRYPKCKACHSATSREQYAANREERLQKALVYREENIEQVRAKSREYQAEHREEGRERAKQWRSNNLEREREKHRRYHADNLEREREKRREYREVHKDEERDRGRRYRDANAEKLQAYHREYYEANKEEIKEKQRVYAQANPETVSQPKRRYRARKRGNGTAPFPKNWKADQLARQKGRCYYCGKKAKQWEVEHVIPISKGGPDTPENCVLACRSCNRSKAAKLLRLL